MPAITLLNSIGSTIALTLLASLPFQYVQASRSLLYTLPRSIGVISMSVGRQVHRLSAPYWQHWLTLNTVSSALDNSLHYFISSDRLAVEALAVVGEQDWTAPATRLTTGAIVAWNGFSHSNPYAAKLALKLAPRFIIGGVDYLNSISKRHFSSVPVDEEWITLYRGHSDLENEAGIMSYLASETSVEFSNQVIIDAIESGIDWNTGSESDLMNGWLAFLQYDHSVSSKNSAHATLPKIETLGIDGETSVTIHLWGIGRAYTQLSPFISFTTDFYIAKQHAVPSITKIKIPRSLVYKNTRSIHPSEREFLISSLLVKKYIVAQMKRDDERWLSDHHSP